MVRKIADRRTPLTNSRRSCFSRCKRQHWYRYVLKLRSVREHQPLRMGSAIHIAREAFVKQGAEAALGVIEKYYEKHPTDDMYEKVICLTLMAGYTWRYADDPAIHLAVEQPFLCNLVNPETGNQSRTFSHAGKIDGIIEIPGPGGQNRQMLYELKTTGEDIAEGSNYWLRLQYDPQISGYVLAAKAYGFNPEGVVYDVIRKPTIRPKNIPTLDANGDAIVLDANGDRVYLANGQPRKSGDKEKGYVAVTTPETPDQFADRLWESIQENPDFYYQRREITRLDDDLAAWQGDAWGIAKTILWCMKNRYWPREISKFSCDYCDYLPICFRNEQPKPGEVPDGYEKCDPFEELRAE